MIRSTATKWLERKLWRHVLFLGAAGILLAGVSVFKGWMHRQVGFDAEGKPFDVAEKRLEPQSPAPSQPRGRRPVSEGAALRLILDDLERRDEERRPHLRYLTLAHRNNDPTCADSELDADRAAVREMVVFISRGHSTRSDFIDPEQLVFRLDLEDLDWSGETDWHLVTSVYRYGLTGTGNDTLSELRKKVQELTQDPIPALRADWFVVALTRGPLAGPSGVVRIPTNELPESVRMLSQRYASETVDLATCASEEGLTDPQVLADLIQRTPNLQQEFGIAPLLRGERIRREWWESDRNLFSPYQEVARLLKIGKPVRVQ